MHHAMRHVITLVALTAGAAAWAQVEETDKLFTIDTPASLEFTREEEPLNTPKKKKPKKNVFYGVKTRKGFVRKGVGERVTYELFHYLKVPETPKTLVRDIYYYDFARREIVRTSRFDPKRGVLVHGPYQKIQQGVLVESGIFYKGLKHGRWMRYSRDSVLLDKEKYFMGWPKESLISYWDPVERKKPKEIIPIEYGQREGNYYLFHENGRVAVTGEYRWNEKVGDWYEYYPNGNRKRVIAYPKEPFQKGFTPYIKIEWNERGQEIYRSNRTSG
jgi:antitoxin component YwqK of YwqJK toxin-antitoxin module